MKPAPPPFSASRRSGAPAWRRRLPWIAGLLLIALIVVGLWPRAVPVEVGAVTAGPLVVTVDEEGMTRVRNRYIVSAPVAGQLRRIDWKAGAVVEAGRTPLAVLEPAGADILDTRTLAQAEARVQAVQAARDAATAQRDRAAAAERLAAAELERATRLRGEGAMSVQEFELARMRAETAAQEVRAATFALQVSEFEVQQARATLMRGQPASRPPTESEPPRSPASSAAEPLVITSAVNGRILRVLQESGRVVPAGFPLLEIGDVTDLEVRIEVLSRDAVAVSPGARVLLEQWGGPEPLQARVRWVEPSGFTKISALGVEEQRVYVIADLMDPPERRPTLGDSYRVEARIVVWEKPDALRAPAGALFQQGGRWRAFVVDGGRARLREVNVGRSNGVETEVLGGLAQGDRLIVYPGDKVTDGAHVTPLVIGAP